MRVSIGASSILRCTGTAAGVLALVGALMAAGTNAGAGPRASGADAPKLPDGVGLAAGEHWLTHDELTATDVRIQDTPGNEVDNWAQKHGALGVSFDDAGGYSVALPASGSADSLAKMDTSSVGVSMNLKRSSMTKASVASTAANIEKFAHEHPEYQFSFYYDAGKDATHVETEAPVAVVNSLKESVPPKLDVHSAPRVDNATQERSACTTARTSIAAAPGQNNDPSPHFGAARISDTCGRCTSGFTMQDITGHPYQITAGHCFPSGYQVASGNYFYGRITDRAQFPIWDLEKITESGYLSAIYRSQHVVTQVSGASDPRVGRTGICISGASYATPEECGASVRSDNATLCVGGQCTHNLFSFSRGGNRPKMADGGDSGGPVYSVSTSGQAAHMWGLYIGGSPYEYYAEKYSSIRSVFGGQVYVR